MVNSVVASEADQSALIEILAKHYLCFFCGGGGGGAKTLCNAKKYKTSFVFVNWP